MRGFARARAGQPRTAFTLIELLVALMIIAALTVISIPALAPMMKASSSDSAARILKAALLHSRYSAIAEGQDAVCWLAEGSVYETGTISESSVSGPPTTQNLNIVVDDYSQTSLFSKSTPSGTWVSSTGGYDGVSPHNTQWYCNVAGCTATWTVQTLLPSSGSGQLKVEAYSTLNANRTAKAVYTMKIADGQTATSPENTQVPTTGWQDVGKGATYAFTGGTTERSVTVSKNDSGYLIADAIQLSGDWTSGCPANVFIDVNKTWTAADVAAGLWTGYHVTWASRTDSASCTRQISLLEAPGKVTVSADWSPYPELQAPYLITESDPSTTPQADQRVSSGTATTPRWDPLPQGMAVEPYAYDKNGAKSNTIRSFPIVFKSTGRAALPDDQDRIFIRVYDRERPTDPALSRFIRIDRNTGRAVIGRTISELH